MNIRYLLPIFLFVSFVKIPAEPNKTNQLMTLQPQEMLHKGILNDSAEEIKNAVALGANVNKPIEEKSPILWAVLLKKSNAVEALLDFGVKTDKSTIELALKLNDIKSAVIIAIKGKHDLDTEYLGRCLFQHCIENNSKIGCLNAILELIKAGANLKYIDSNTGMSLKDYILNLSNPIGDHAEENYDLVIQTCIEIFSQMINRGMSINYFWFADKCTWYAKFYEDTTSCKKFLEFLLSNHGNINYRFSIPGISSASQWTPLFVAIEKGNAKILQLLLDAGANINEKVIPYPKNAGRPGRITSDKIYTPLSFAIDLGYSEIIELLLKRGAQL